MKFKFEIRLGTVLILCCLQIIVLAQKANIYPTNWWVGMKNPALQIMVHGNNIATSAKSIHINYPGVILNKVHTVDNPNYLFIDLTIASVARAGKLSIPIIEDGNAGQLFQKYSERTTGFSRATSALDNKEYEIADIATSGSKSMWVLELKR